MRLTVVTATGNRQEAFSLCEKWIDRQTIKPFQWIVLCDGDKPTVCAQNQKFIYCPQFKGPESLVKKVRHLMISNLVKGDAICMVEDDDFYAPTWLEFCAEQLKHHDLIGEGCSIYYNPKHRWWYGHGNMGHASLCSTALNRSLFQTLAASCDIPHPFIDAVLWKKVTSRKKVFDPAKHGGYLVVGIKGMPGRVGYGQGHVVRDVSAQDDLDLRKLRSLIGNDAEFYAPFWTEYGKVKTMNETETSRVHGLNWRKWLGHLAGKPDIIGMEVGTFKGESAEVFLRDILTHPTARFYCCDCFEGSPEHRIANIDCSTLEADTRTRLAIPLIDGRAHILKGYSNDVLRTFPHRLDFGYVDAGHDCMNVMRDAVLMFDLLKPGGIMIFDDYLWQEMPDLLDCPKIAIDAFLQSYLKQLEVLEPRGWQICVRKK